MYVRAVVLALLMILSFSAPEYAGALSVTREDMEDHGDRVSSQLQKHVGGGYCKIVGSISFGLIGAGLATLAVIALGIAATLGKANWGQALLVAAMISVIFGAAYIVELMVDDYSPGCTEVLSDEEDESPR